MRLAIPDGPTRNLPAWGIHGIGECCYGRLPRRCLTSRGPILAAQDSPQDEPYPGWLPRLTGLGALPSALHVLGVDLGRIHQLIRCVRRVEIVVHARSLRLQPTVSGTRVTNRVTTARHGSICLWTSADHAPQFMGSMRKQERPSTFADKEQVAAIGSPVLPQDAEQCTRVPHGSGPDRCLHRRHRGETSKPQCCHNCGLPALSLAPSSALLMVAS